LPPVTCTNTNSKSTATPSLSYSWLWCPLTHFILFILLHIWLIYISWATGLGIGRSRFFIVRWGTGRCRNGGGYQ
jgi:hypothetical protein